MNQKRIDEVAAALTAGPRAFGRPVSDRTAWEALARKQAFRKIIPSAEGLLEQAIPELPDELYLDFSRTGNRARWQRVAGQWGHRLHELFLAECLENKGRFLPAIEELIRAYCEEKTWVMPAHDRSLANFHQKAVDIDLRSSALGCDLATMQYILGERLCPAIRDLIGKNLHERVFQPFRDMVNGKRRANWWLHGENNWNAVCLDGVVGAALAYLEPKEERAWFIVAGEKFTQNFLDGFTADGYCSEGLGYWGYGFGHYLTLAEAVYQASGGQTDLFHREGVRAPAQFPAGIEIMNGVYPAFADCPVSAHPDSRFMFLVSRKFAFGLDRWENIDTATSRLGIPQSLMFSFPNSVSDMSESTAESNGPGLRTWFDKAGVLIVRPGQDSSCRLGAALKGGHNAEMHNHNDVGSYVAVIGDRPILLDPGSEVYTARTFSKRRYESKVLNSYGHPVPVVAGKLQRTGRNARANVLQTDFSKEADRLVLDIRPAYEAPSLKKLVRTFVYSRAGAGSLAVTDEVLFSTPQTFETALITLGQWQRLEHDSLMVYDFNQVARVEIQTGDHEFELVPEEIHEDVHTPSLPTRLGIRLKGKVSSAAVTVKIMPAQFPGTDENQVLVNGSFEHQSFGWQIHKSGMGKLSNEQAASGNSSLKIVDTSRKRGSNINSAKMRIDGGARFELRGKVFPVSGNHLALYMKYRDTDGTLLNPQNSRGYIGAVGSVGGSSRRWEKFAFPFTTPEKTATLQVWIHSINAALVEAYLDDLKVVPVGQP